MIKDRIIQLIEYKKLPKEKFYNEIGVTSANFRGKAKESDIGASVIEKIFTIIPDVNLYWLLTGKGEMINQISDDHKETDYWKSKYYECLEKYTKLLESK